MEYGTNEFQIKFKAKAKTDDANFSLEGAKFRAVDASTSYTGDQITGLETTVSTKVEASGTTNTENNNISNEQVNNTVEPDNNVVENNIVNDTVDNSQSENKVHTNTIVKPGTNTTDKTTSGESELPQTGESDMIIKLLVLSALLIIVNKIRVDRFKDI